MLWFGCFATASRALSRNHAREETEMKHNWKLPAALLCALLLFGCAQGGAAGRETRIESFVDVRRYQKKGGYGHG